MREESREERRGKSEEPGGARNMVECFFTTLCVPSCWTLVGIGWYWYTTRPPLLENE